MTAISLTANVRSALSALQDTAVQQATTNNHLATGKKVASALDNPVNFFTAQGLNGRSSSLTSLLDGMSNGIQTIQAANKGITSITSVIQQLQSLVKTARQDSTGATLGTALTGANTATGNNTQLTFSLADGSTAGVALTDSTGTAIANRDIANAINSNASLSGNVSASVDAATGNLKIQNKTGADISVKGFGTAFDGTGTSTLTAGTATLSDVRRNAANQFNQLLDQVDTIAKDSGYNGTNLLNGDTLKMIFNEKTGVGNQSSLSVQAKNADGTAASAMSASSLGLNKVTFTGSGATDWTSNTNLDAFSDALTASLSTLQNQSAQFGTALALTQTRQDFTKGIVDVLTTGASNLTDADMNQEAANSQALSTRNSLAISALSLANSANQGVLQLLR